jgi:peptide/nickel transport system permease protein
VLILIFGVWLKWLPISASWPEGAGLLTQIYYLLLPSMPLFLVLFGYIARMARAGTIEALDADYTRTAVLKGLPWHVVLWHHVLRNSLLPTITVVATQVGYLIGGLVVVEVLFHYQGIGGLIYTAARGKDFPMLEAGILTIGIIYTVATFAADLLYSALNPRIHFGAVE